ncbi:MAG: glutamyl-tRNA reductase [Actinobacteria bacterium]|nr:glutamyl-tRNA reductase [Actinomycetota bacterium]
MSLLVMGLSHKTASVDLREKLAFPERVLPEALSHLSDTGVVDEAVILSTCNRTEIYVDIVQPTGADEVLVGFLKEFHNLDTDDIAELRRHLYILQGVEMVEHLFSVVSSLDSLVLGEAQILAQVKNGYAVAFDAGFCGVVFNHLFPQALEVGKRAHTETSIGANSISVSTTAVNLARRVFEDLEQRTILVVGAGEMGELTANYLVEQGVKKVTVTNRTFSAAVELAGRIGGEAVEFNDLVDCLARTDIVISSTAATDYVITKKQVEFARHRRRGHSLLLIDIALPRDIDPACNDLPDVYVYDLDAFSSMIDSNIYERELEAAKVKTIVASEVETFFTWMQERKVAPTISHMYSKMETICDGEVERASRMLASAKGAPITDAEKEVLKTIAQSVGKKLLHGPTVRLRKQATNPDGYRYTDAARFLFGLDAYPLGRSCRSCKEKNMCKKDEDGTCYLAKKAGLAKYHRTSPEVKDDYGYATPVPSIKDTADE